jgi:1,4-dihydroxy-2-naphthoyl-CoA hydrolase
MIWFKTYTIEDLKKRSKDSMSDFLEIDFLEIGPDFLRAKMPVINKTKQPYGFLHGGASVVLAETLGSICSMMSIDTDLFNLVGLEINANHVRKVSEGYVTGTAKPIHIGKTTHVLGIEIVDYKGQLICNCRLTVAIILKKD